MIIVYWLICVLLIVGTLFLFKIEKAWEKPSIFFIGCWSIFMLLPLLFAPNLNYWIGSFIWITLCCLVVYFGAKFGEGLYTSLNISKERKNTNITFRYLGKLIVISTILGLVSVQITLTDLGQNYTVFFSSDILSLSNQVSVMRYTENYSPPFLSNALLTFVYFGGFLGGICWAYAKRKVAFLPFLPILLITLISSTKSGIVFVVIFWLAGYLATSVYLGRKHKLLTFKNFKVSVFIIAALNLIFIVSSMLRYGMSGLASVSAVYERLFVYFFGYLSGFSVWFESVGYNFNKMAFGQYTIGGIFDILGIERDQGLFENTATIAPGIQTNIYTLFRILIEDFNILGSLIVLFVVGGIFQMVYFFVKKGSFIMIPLLALFYSVTMFSFTTSVITYNSIVLAVILLYFYFIFLKVTIRNVPTSNNADEVSIEKDKKKKKFKRYKITW